MPFGIRPSNVRVCHSTTRALWETVGNSSELRVVNGKSTNDARKRFVEPRFLLLFLLVLMLAIEIESRDQTQSPSE
jgi:hypothetical protein